MCSSNGRIAGGAVALGNVRQISAGSVPPTDAEHWQRLTGDEQALSTEYAFHRGIYAAGDRLLAVNRPAIENQGRDHRGRPGRRSVEYYGLRIR